MKMKKKFSLMVLLISLVSLLSACGGSSASSDEGKKEKLVIVDWGGDITEIRKKVMFEPFEEEYNVEVVVETPTDYGKLTAMVESGNVTWDVVKGETFFALQAEKKGLLEPLDYDVIDAEGTPEEMAQVASLGIEYFTNTTAFRSDAKPITTWEEFWNVDQFPGNRSLYKATTPTFEIALLADGVPVEDLYPLDIDRAFASLDKLKPHIKTWWTTGAQPAQLLSDGSVNYAMAWNGRISVAKADGSPVDQDYTQGFLQGESLFIPKGAKNKDLAMKFIAFVAQAEVQAEFSRQTDYLPANEKALDLLSEEDKERLGLKVGQTERLVVNEEWWVENYEEVNERFQKWLLE